MYARPLNLTGNRITYIASSFRPRARIIHQLEIPQRTSLLPYQGVLSFGWKHARRRHPTGLGASCDDATSSQRLPARRAPGRSLRARSSKACNSKAATPRKFFSYGGALTRGGRSDQRYELGAVTQTRTTNSTTARPNDPHIISWRMPLRSCGKSSMRPNISWRGPIICCCSTQQVDWLMGMLNPTQIPQTLALRF